MSEIGQSINERLTMRAVLECYGFRPNGNKMCCPFHKEKTPSFIIYPKSFYCFGCGEGGDIITFVEKLFDLSFIEASRKLSDDFRLFLFDEKKHSKSKYKRIKPKESEPTSDRLKHLLDVLDFWQKRAEKYAPKPDGKVMYGEYLTATDMIVKVNLNIEEERRRLSGIKEGHDIHEGRFHDVGQTVQVPDECQEFL